VRLRLRLPKRLGDRIKARAARDGTTVPVTLHAAVTAGLRQRSTVLDAARTPRGGPTYDVAFLPLPPAMAAELRELAKKLGTSTNDIARRAVEASLAEEWRDRPGR